MIQIFQPLVGPFPRSKLMNLSLNIHDIICTSRYNYSIPSDIKLAVKLSSSIKMFDELVSEANVCGRGERSFELLVL